MNPASIFQQTTATDERWSKTSESMNAPTPHIPDAVRASLGEGAALAVSISGGKDSQAMLLALADLHAAHGWTGDLYAIHADRTFALTSPH